MNKFTINDTFGYPNYKYLKKIIRRTLKMENVHSSFLSIVFIDDELMHELNKKYRGISIAFGKDIHNFGELTGPRMFCHLHLKIMKKCVIIYAN